MARPAEKPKTKNQVRKELGQDEVGRKIGVTKAKKAIRKQDFEKLLDFVGKNKMMNHPTRYKLRTAYTLLYCTSWKNRLYSRRVKKYGYKRFRKSFSKS